MLKLTHNDETSYTLSEVIGAVLTLIVGAAGLSFFEAYILTFAWEWFVVPPTNFEGLSYWGALGVIILLRFIEGHVLTHFRNEDNQLPLSRPLVLNAFLRILSEALAVSIAFGIMALIHLGC